MENEQTLKQKKIILAQSDLVPAVIEIIRDCIPKTPLVGRDEFETLKNTISYDALSTLILEVSNYLERIREGELHGKS